MITDISEKTATFIFVVEGLHLLLFSIYWSEGLDFVSFNNSKATITDIYNTQPLKAQRLKDHQTKIHGLMAMLFFPLFLN